MQLELTRSSFVRTNHAILAMVSCVSDHLILQSSDHGFS
jgi:hypothetical protein